MMFHTDELCVHATGDATEADEEAKGGEFCPLTCRVVVRQVDVNILILKSERPPESRRRVPIMNVAIPKDSSVQHLSCGITVSGLLVQAQLDTLPHAYPGNVP